MAGLRIIAFALALAGPALAQEDPLRLICTGDDPAWLLRMADGEASLDFEGESRMSQRLDTRPEGADWPRALTLAGRDDTGILILEDRVCQSASRPNAPFTARLLTQRNAHPILLTGCCVIPGE